MLFYALLATLIRRLRSGESIRWVAFALVVVTGFALAVTVWVYAAPPSRNPGAASSGPARQPAAVVSTPFVDSIHCVPPTISSPGGDQLVQDYCNNRSLHPSNTQLSAAGCICVLRTLADKLGLDEARRRWNELVSNTTHDPRIASNLLRDVPLIADCP